MHHGLEQLTAGLSFHDVLRGDHHGLGAVDRALIATPDQSFSNRNPPSLPTPYSAKRAFPHLPCDEKFRNYLSRSLDKAVGPWTCAAIVPSLAEYTFFGHASGHITKCSRHTRTLVATYHVAREAITALVAPSRFLWCGYQSGFISVLDVRGGVMRVKKLWRGHPRGVAQLAVDTEVKDSLVVVSIGFSGHLKCWDGLLKDDWVTDQLLARERQYCSSQAIEVAFFSFNVDAADPEKLQRGGARNSGLIRQFLETCGQPELLHFAFQEMVDLDDHLLTAEIVWFHKVLAHVPGHRHPAARHYRKWLRYLQREVDDHFGAGRYRLILQSTLVGLCTIVFVRQDLLRRVHQLHATHVDVGAFEGHYGNKGALLTSMVIDDSSFCFINCHLAAGIENPGRRARDLHEILDSKSRFPAPSPHCSHAFAHSGDGTQVSDHEFVFLCGDTNLRIHLGRRETIALATAGELEELAKHDELALALAQDPFHQLHGYEEQALTFLPTYKYDHGSTRYDTSEKRRTPAWCDRVLVRSVQKDKVQGRGYGRFEADISDHRPIWASYEVSVKSVDATRLASVLREIERDWRQERNALMDNVHAQRSALVGASRRRSMTR